MYLKRPMSRALQVLKLIDAVYDAATDVAQWEAALEGIARLFDARSAQLAFVDLEYREVAFTATWGIGPDMIARYRQTAMTEDPRLPLWLQNPNRAVHCRMGITDVALHQSLFYQQVLAPAGVEYAMGAMLTDERELAARFGLMRSADQPGWNEDDCADFGLLVPHMRRALQLHRRLATLDLQRSAAIGVLDKLPMGVAVVDQSCRVLFMNDTARQMAQSSGGAFTLRNEVFFPIDATARSDLRRIVDQTIAAALDEAPTPGRALSLPAANAGGSASIWVTSLWRNIRRYGLSPINRPLAVLFMSGRTGPAPVIQERLRRLYGLTATESEVTAQIVQGRTVKEAALALDVAESTVRTHVRAIFGKTGTRRLPDLVRLVLSGPATLAG